MVRRKGYGRASGAGTIINATATFKGAAFGLDIWTEAEVEVGEDLHEVRGEVEGVEGAEGAEERAVEEAVEGARGVRGEIEGCLLYTSPSPRDLSTSRMPSSA